MPKRPLRPCKVPGCPSLVEGPGYCQNHSARAQEDTKARFRALDKRVPDELRRFYSSSAWTAASKHHREKEPLCRRCKDKGRVVCGELTHHNPPLEELLRDCRNPYDDDVLETLCHNCHQVELSAKGRKSFYKAK